MATLTEQFAALNEADLSQLSARIAALKAELEKSLAASGKTSNATVTAADVKPAANQAGVSAEELMVALEEAKRRGLM